MKEGEWLETKDGKIIEVHSVDKWFVEGREIIEKDPELKYGEWVCLEHDEFVSDEPDEDETEDDMSWLFVEFSMQGKPGFKDDGRSD